MPDTPAILQAIHELREDFRQYRELDSEEHKDMKESISSVKAEVHLQSKYWSNVFYTGKVFGIAATVAGIIFAYLGVSAFW